MFVLLSAIAVLGADPTPPARHTPPAAKPVATSASMGRQSVLSAVAVTLECTARASGRVENCRVLGETHPGMGFAEAAIALMRDVEVASGGHDVQFARTIQFMP
jgi:hypothetical protein